MIFRKFATGSNISCFLLLLLVGCSGKGIAQQSFQSNHISFGKVHLEDAQNRIFMAREGLIMTIRPLPIETLNHEPGGKAATIRQLVNHLAFFEVWMVERIRRVKAGEPDFARDKAEQMLPDIGSIKASEFLSHGHFRDGQGQQVGLVHHHLCR